MDFSPSSLTIHKVWMDGDVGYLQHHVHLGSRLQGLGDLLLGPHPAHCIHKWDGDFIAIMSNFFFLHNLNDMTYRMLKVMKI